MPSPAGMLHLHAPRIGRLHLPARTVPTRKILMISAATLVAIGALLGVVLGLSLAGGNTRPNGSFADPSVGIRGNLPARWSASSRAGGVAVVSPDRSALVEIAAPAPAADAAAVLTSTVNAIGRHYSHARVIWSGIRQVDHHAATAAALSATTTGGVSMRVLAAAIPGRHLAYLLEVFTTTGASPSTVVSAQDILSSLVLSD